MKYQNPKGSDACYSVGDTVRLLPELEENYSDYLGREVRGRHYTVYGIDEGLLLLEWINQYAPAKDRLLSAYPQDVHLIEKGAL